MLTGLKIENIAVIESAELEFDSGLNVLTGETGAGKSIIIDSINAVLGERTSRELIRTGAESARVFASFADAGKAVEAVLEHNDIEPQPDGTLVLSRSLSASGRNSCRVNGCPVTVSVLREIGSGAYQYSTVSTTARRCSCPSGTAGLLTPLRESRSGRSIRQFLLSLSPSSASSTLSMTAVMRRRQTAASSIFR